MFVNDVANINDKRIGNIWSSDFVEIIIHPDYRNGEYIDSTNLDENKSPRSLDDTISKLSDYEKIKFTDIYSR